MPDGVTLGTYSVLLGAYEEPQAHPLPDEPDGSTTGPRVLVTDNPDLQRPGWTVRVVSPVLPSDPIRSARYLKLHPHVLFPEWTGSLYVDNSVQLLRPPEEVAQALRGDGASLGLLAHSYRQTLGDEFDEVLRLRYDSAERLGEQRAAYQEEDPEALTSRPLWTGMMFRDHTDPLLRDLMDAWWVHLLRFSRRDQLALPFLLRRLPDLEVAVHDVDNNTSDLHRWPVVEGRPEQSGRLVWGHEERQRLQAQLDRAEYRLLETAQRTSLWAAELVDLRARVAELTTELDTARDDAARTRKTLDDVLASRSWTVTAPLRRARTAVTARQQAPAGGTGGSEAADSPESLRERRFEERMRAAYDAARGTWLESEPTTLNQKVWHRRMFDRRPVLREWCDKVACWDYVAERVGTDLLPEVLDVLEPTDPLGPNLPAGEIVLKATHASGGSAVLWDGPTRDGFSRPPWFRRTYGRAEVPWGDLRAAYADTLKHDFGWEQLEWAYLGLPPRVMVQRLHRGPDGELPDDLFFFTFDGEVRFLVRYTDRVRREGGGMRYYDPDWSPLDVDGGRPLLDFPRPRRLQEMIEVAQELGRGESFLRVDFLMTENSLLISELTPYHLGGGAILRPRSADETFGSYWSLT